MYSIYKAYLNRRFPLGEHPSVHFTADNLPLHTEHRHQAMWLSERHSTRSHARTYQGHKTHTDE